MWLVAFCEAGADFQIASELFDRVMRAHGPGWVGDVMDADPEGVRAWRGDGNGRAYFDLHKLTDYTRALSVRVPHGHFEGRPGAAGALMARTAFAIVRRLVRTGVDVRGVVVVWDMDDQPGPRREGLEQARSEARSWAPFRIVLGCPDPMREAWVLCGFEPVDDREHVRLREASSELGFAPHLHAHRLTAKHAHLERSAKRVLRVLTLDDRDREAACWQETSLDTLRERGEATGLRAYLGELAEHLVPLLEER